MLQVLRAHATDVVLQGDVALKAYIAILCFKYFKRMLQVFQAHVTGVVFTDVATTIYMFQQIIWACFSSTSPMLQQRYCTCFNSKPNMFH
jgi:hypothetical protein